VEQLGVIWFRSCAKPAKRLARLRGARLVTATETEAGKRWAESRLKELTGGERIPARFMNQNFFEYLPAFKPVISGNHKPRLRSVGVATPTLPVQAIVPDKDTWIDGGFGFQLDRANLSHPTRVAKLCEPLSRPRFLLVERARRPPAQRGKINNLRVRRSD
jgi:hypothetical protein